MFCFILFFWQLCSPFGLLRDILAFLIPGILIIGLSNFLCTNLYFWCPSDLRVWIENLFSGWHHNHHYCHLYKFIKSLTNNIRCLPFIYLPRSHFPALFYLILSYSFLWFLTLLFSSALVKSPWILQDLELKHDSATYYVTFC